MTDVVAKLKNAEDCEAFEINAKRLGREDLAAAARRRGVEFRATMYGAATAVELECIQAVYAYEQTLNLKNGKKTRAQRTWNMIAKHGIIPAVERAVDRRDETAGFTALKSMGLEEYAFESVILRHPNSFSPAVVARAAKRIEELGFA